VVAGRGVRGRGVRGRGLGAGVRVPGRGRGRPAGKRGVGLGLAVVTVVVAVAGLWRWSTGAADPVAPGGTPPTGEVAGGAAAGAPPAGHATAGQAGTEPRSADGPSGDSEVGDAAALSTVRAAAIATAAAPTMHFTLGIVLADGSTSPPATEISGAVDNVSGNVTVTLREWGAGPGSIPTTLEAIAVGDALFVRSSALVPPGEPLVWWRVPADAAGQSTPAMVAGLVALVGTAVSAEPAGSGLVDGAEVTRLRVGFPGEDAASGVVGSVSGWGVVGIDGDGRLRSVEVRAVGAWGQATGREVLVRLALDRLGDPVEVGAPDPAEVRAPGAGYGAGSWSGVAGGVGVGMGGAGG
jgi:hypothetical protein